MNLGQPPQESFRWTLQLNFKANSSTENLRPTLQLKIKANSWNEFRWTPPQKIQVNPSAEN